MSDENKTFRPSDAAVDAEVDAALGDIDMDALYESNAPEQTATELTGEHPGKIMSIDVPKNEAMIDLGGKHQGIVPLDQWDGRMPTIGEDEAFVIERRDAEDELYRLNRKGKASRNATVETIEIGQVVEATVTGLNKGGLECRIGRALRAFMPSGQVDIHFHEDLSIFLNEKFEAKVQKIDKATKNVILSRRMVIEAERREKKKELMAEIQPGDVRSGTVSNIMDFGAFVDLGGADGLLHVSEMTYRRGVKPEDIVKKGDHVEVTVLSVDHDKNKISLSLRASMPNPWDNATEKYQVGSTVTGRVVKTTNFGAFVEVEEGIEGLLPISELSYQRVNRTTDVVKEGETVRLVILSMDPKSKKISFSLKAAAPDPWEGVEGKYAAGTEHVGTVTRVADFGAFVQLEPAVEGLVHISELSDKRVRQTSDVVKQGQQVTARVLSLDTEQRRLRLSLRSAKAIEADAKKNELPVTPDKTPAEKKAREKKLKKTPLKGGLDF
ncbi:MAG: S1 RNA-binding domain-containing protein [Planctomycetota bacterium]